ncbi:MAG: hypothetical protein COA47_10420 [Robiginitomaculum sp.]|nr:MAG: hypothetical protein COA47_10420 [Robiginitomaculum sp.]
MATINTAALTAARQRSARELDSVLYTTNQFNNMLQDAVDCILSAEMVSDINTCVTNANPDFSPNAELLSIIVRLAYLEAGAQT